MGESGAVLDVPREVVQDGLPSLALLFGAVALLGVEGLAHLDALASGVNSTRTLRPSPRVYSIRRCGATRVYVPSKSKPTLPSRACMRAQNLPPSRKSTLARGVCQSGEAAFHCSMARGSFHAAHTRSMGAWTLVSTVIFLGMPCADACSGAG